MQFGYSTKCLLAAITFVAAATLACHRQTTATTSALITLTLGTALFALTVVLPGQGRRRAAAVGFLLWVVGYGAFVWLVPEHAPSTSVLSSLPVTAPSQERQASVQKTMALIADEQARVKQIRSKWQPEWQVLQTRLQSLEAELDGLEGSAHLLVSFQVIATMLAGVVGSFAGAFVYDTRERDQLHK